MKRHTIIMVSVLLVCAVASCNRSGTPQAPPLEPETAPDGSRFFVEARNADGTLRNEGKIEYKIDSSGDLQFPNEYRYTRRVYVARNVKKAPDGKWVNHGAFTIEDQSGQITGLFEDGFLKEAVLLVTESGSMRKKTFRVSQGVGHDFFTDLKWGVPEQTADHMKRVTNAIPEGWVEATAADAGKIDITWEDDLR